MKNYFTYFLVLLCCSNLLLNAQNTQLRAYSIEDGLPQSQVYDMVQDNIGYLWLGTQGGGLCNFNGTNFSVWNESNGLLSNYIYALYIKNNSLFIGTERGLSIKNKNNFTNFICPKINRFFYADDILYVNTNNGVYSYSKSEKLKKLAINAAINSSSINDIVYDGSFYWIATNKGLWRTNKLSTKATSFKKIESNNFKSIVYHNNRIFAATFNDGILVISDAKEAILIKKPHRINTISIHNKNELWISTDNNGVIILDTDSYARIKHINKSEGLAVSHIRKTFTDRQANIWITTSGGGFYKYYQNNFNHFDKGSGLKGNRVYAVHNANKNIWVSSSEAGLTKIDSSGIHHIPKIEGFSDVKIKTITSDINGNIWAGSNGKGLLYQTNQKIDSLVVDASDSLNIVTNTVSKTITKNYVFNEANGFPSNWIRKLVPDNKTMYAATISSGIIQFYFDHKNEAIIIKKRYGKRNGIKDLLIKDIALDPKNRLWYATEKGHLGYVKNGENTSLGTVLEQQTAIRTLLFYQDKLFIGTAGMGIWVSKLDTDIPIFKPLKGVKKLYSDNIYQLIADNEGYLWAGSERGVDKIQINQDNLIEDIYHFGRNDGFLGIETCLNAVDKDANGNIWFGTLYGLTKYTPSLHSETSLKPEIYFNDVQVAYKSIDSIDLKTWTNTDKVLRLNPNQTQLSFSYKSIDIDHPNQIEYRSKLNKNQWSPWSKESKQNFAGLAYGLYSFSVQSRNYRWEESEVIKFNFDIDSPLYQKTWFQWTIIGIAFLLLLFLGWLYMRRVRLKNKADKEQLQLQNHLLTLEHKALQLQMNPHFIFNVLNGIKAMAIHKPEKMNITINSFATLLRETLNNSRKEHITLAQEITTLRNYISVEQLMATKTFMFSITDNCDLDSEEILVPPMLIQPFVENAIRHGILKGKKEGQLQISFNTTEKHLHCNIKDNGIGIFHSQAAKEKTDHQSMALTVTKERLISIAQKNTLKITEIKNEDGTIAGTNISFKIPLLTDY